MENFHGKLQKLTICEFEIVHHSERYDEVSHVSHLGLVILLSSVPMLCAIPARQSCQSRMYN